MRVVVIGGTGHIGTYLVPGLVRAGHATLVISRGSRRPYRHDRPVGSACDIAKTIGGLTAQIELRPDGVELRSR